MQTVMYVPDVGYMRNFYVEPLLLSQVNAQPSAFLFKSKGCVSISKDAKTPEERGGVKRLPHPLLPPTSYNEL